MAASSEFLDWFVTFRNPKEIWNNHPTFLCGEIAFYIFGLLTLKHALKQGGQFIYLWFTTVLHGIVVESVSYALPDIDNFWHAQSMVMLLGQRLPLHIMVVYPVFIYTASVAASRLHLKKWAEPFAVGLLVVLIDVPFDIMGIKQLWWTWHDTDPNIFDRHYWVPWNSYYFHATFASSLSFLFHGTRRLLTRTDNYQGDSVWREVLCSTITGCLAMPCGILQFLPVYHILHDNYDVHTEVCVFLLVAFYGLLIWTSDRNPIKTARTMPNKGWLDEISVMVIAHFLLYIVFVLFVHPERQRSLGLHEPTGPCNATSPVQTPFGQVLTKRTYLCTQMYDEAYFDFRCLPHGKAPADGLDWYTVCGTPYENHIEYIVVVSAFSLFGLYVYLQMLRSSGRQIKVRSKSSKQKTK